MDVVPRYIYIYIYIYISFWLGRMKNITMHYGELKNQATVSN